MKMLINTKGCNTSALPVTGVRVANEHIFIFIRFSFSQLLDHMLTPRPFLSLARYPHASFAKFNVACVDVRKSALILLSTLAHTRSLPHSPLLFSVFVMAKVKSG